MPDMTVPLVIVGAGGFGREVLDIVNDLNRAAEADDTERPFDFLGFIDDGHPDEERLARIGASYLGTSDAFATLPNGSRYAIGIGAGTVRRTIDERATAAGLEPATLIHSSATIGADVRIAPGAVICAHVSITTNISIGRHAHVNLNSTIGHDSILEDYSTVNPLSAISGDVIIGQESIIGTNSAINQGIRIGSRSIVASGSAVTRPVADSTLVAGVPAVMKKLLQ
jgi:sugar O-acyltransferase (sialic acid O-acetyltransferase NeuD family)